MNHTASALSRRDFIAGTGLLAFGLAASVRAASTPAAPAFASRWTVTPDRVWPGPEYWANPLQDWRVHNGRLECIRAAGSRSIHLLTHDLASRDGSVRASVRLGRVEGGPIAGGRGGAGFAFGVRGPLNEYRNNAIFGSGFNAGLRAGGELFLGDGPNGRTAKVDLAAEAVELRFEAGPAGPHYRAKLTALDAKDGRELGSVERTDLPAAFLHGNLALVANYALPQHRRDDPPPGADRWWFAEWTVAGDKVDVHPDRAFGPLFFNQYTLHRGTLKMSVQLPALGGKDEQTVRLQIRRDGNWATVAEGVPHPLARNVLFRVGAWSDREDVPYRIVYLERTTDGKSTEHVLAGTVRRDPIDRAVLSVADISCNAHYTFPNTACAESLRKTDPDLVAFTGDQYYEPTGGFGVDASSVDNACLDVLRKWCMHGWTWRDLTRDRPSIAIPDDHDVYHGNLWGEGGAAAPGRNAPDEAKGGYKMMAEFVNAVHLMQTSHHPDSSAPVGKQGIGGYYGPLTYGGIGFAILADRQYKSGPDGKVPPTTSGRADHVNDPAFDPKTADLPGLELLGAPQMEFLRGWARDWNGVEMKAAISQTLFTAMATHHGKKDGRLIADYDTNAWPQSARNAALRELRRVHAFHLAGDQHLPAVVHYGIDRPRDAVVAFASPAINNLYPRWFRPDHPGANRPAGSPEWAGDFTDSFGHPLTVLACANPKTEFRKDPLEAEQDKSAGIGIVRFDKRARTITVDCWPILADPTKPGTQFPGWPVTVAELDNHRRGDGLHLPEIRVTGCAKPLFEVIDEASGETLYLYRAPGPAWRPHAWAAAAHTVKVSDPETGRAKVLGGLVAAADEASRLDVAL